MPLTKASSSPAPAELAPPTGVEVLTAKALQDLLGETSNRFDKTERAWISKAYRLAEEYHSQQKRLSGEPYITHAVEVAKTLVEMGLDWMTICAALLHDTVEDTTLTSIDIKNNFPDPIADLVSGVTKISSLHFRTSQEEQTENLRKMILAMAKDIRVILIKLSDRMHNIETLKYLSATKQKRIARSTMEIYAPLAGRLGLHRIKSRLEDGAMRYLYPEAYKELSAKVASRKTDRDRLVEKSTLFLRDILREHGLEAEVYGRSKHFWSIFQKMRNQNLSFEEIFDLNALRVICNTRQECYEIIGIIHAVWKPVPEHFSDYIALPKENLYQSIHTKVIGLDGQITEIQVRTFEMHRIAEEGIAAHWSYKEGRKASPQMAEQLTWLRQMADWVQESGDTGELLNDLKQDAFEDAVYCFTPRGDVIEMRRGATVLDFAYRIHTDLGHRCIGAKINHRFVPLRTQLKMGDRVEIETSKTPHASADWLNIVQTPRAKTKIRHWLKQRDYERNIQIGREMIFKALSTTGIHVSPQELNDVLDLHLKSFRVKTVEDLYSEVGFGTIPTSMVVGRFLPIGPEPQYRSAAISTENATILVDGMPGSLTRFAQCCKPKPGDPISGFVTLGRGVSVHHRDCVHLRRWIDQSPDRMDKFVRVSWSTDSPHMKIAIRITCNDRTGMLRDLSEAISSLGILITASNSRSNMRSHRAIIRFTVFIRDNEELNALMTRLRDVAGVLDVTRDTKSR